MTSDTVIAVDVAGRLVAAGPVAHGRTVRHNRRHPTGAERGPEAVVETILQRAPGLADAARADGVTPRAVGVASSATGPGTRVRRGAIDPPAECRAPDPR